MSWKAHLRRRKEEKQTKHCQLSMILYLRYTCSKIHQGYQPRSHTHTHPHWARHVKQVAPRRIATVCNSATANHYAGPFQHQFPFATRKQTKNNISFPIFFHPDTTVRPTCSTHLLVRPLASFTTAVLMKKIQSRSHMTLATPRLKPRYTPANTVLSLAKKKKDLDWLQVSALLPPLWLQLSAACCRVLSAQQPQQSDWHERMGATKSKGEGRGEGVRADRWFMPRCSTENRHFLPAFCDELSSE